MSRMPGSAEIKKSMSFCLDVIFVYRNVCLPLCVVTTLYPQQTFGYLTNGCEKQLSKPLLDSGLLNALLFLLIIKFCHDFNQKRPKLI